jgi:hypothetical protein
MRLSGWKLLRRSLTRETMGATMRQAPATDHLDLWRGIDDAVWREAGRIAPPPRPDAVPPRPAERRMEERRRPPMAPKLPERV